MARQLVLDLQNMGLPAVQGAGQPAPRVGDIVIKGWFVSVEEGSAGKRVLLGFGSGASDLKTVVEGYPDHRSGAAQARRRRRRVGRQQDPGHGRTPWGGHGRNRQPDRGSGPWSAG